MDFEQLGKIENESERVNRTYDIFNEDAGSIIPKPHELNF